MNWEVTPPPWKFYSREADRGAKKPLTSMRAGNVQLLVTDNGSHYKRSARFVIWVLDLEKLDALANYTPEDLDQVVLSRSFASSTEKLFETVRDFKNIWIMKAEKED